VCHGHRGSGQAQGEGRWFVTRPGVSKPRRLLRRREAGLPPYHWGSWRGAGHGRPGSSCPCCCPLAEAACRGALVRRPGRGALRECEATPHRLCPRPEVIRHLEGQWSLKSPLAEPRVLLERSRAGDGGGLRVGPAAFGCSPEGGPKSWSTPPAPGSCKVLSETPSF